MKLYDQLKSEFLNAVRAELLDGLAQCTEGQRLLFRQVYAGGDLEMPIADVVNGMREEKLRWVMQRVSGMHRINASADGEVGG